MFEKLAKEFGIEIQHNEQDKGGLCCIDSDNEIKKIDTREIKKELFMSMKLLDKTIKGVKDSEEYKLAQAYNDGIRTAIKILDKYT